MPVEVLSKLQIITQMSLVSTWVFEQVYQKVML